MASYKVIQDIEAEDKLVGPLTLRQFIYAGISAVCLYICFLAVTKNAAFLLVFFLPIAAVTGFFAFPWKGEQPTEIWALARLRFMIKPRVRVWNQSGVKDIVTITAPKTLETRRPLTNNLSENEVRSRLKALASTIDSRGWATRNASFVAYNQQRSPGVVMTPGQLPVAVSGVPTDDMFDEQSNVSQNFDAMLTKSSQDRRQRVMTQMAQVQLPQAPQAAQSYVIPQTQALPQMPQAFQSFAPTPQLAINPQPSFGTAQNAGPTWPALSSVPVVSYQAPQLPAPVMLAPATMPPSDYWFAGGNNANSTAVQNAAVIALPEQYAAAITSGKIIADVPVAAAAEPNADEVAFAEAARQQNQALQQVNYSHMRVLRPANDGSNNTGVLSLPSLPPSVPGMIDYGRPQPTDDQMQYDTSRSQASDNSLAQSSAKPVTRKPDPVIIEYAYNNDLDVATIARQASKEMKKSAGEVEIRLH